MKKKLNFLLFFLIIFSLIAVAFFVNFQQRKILSGRMRNILDEFQAGSDKHGANFSFLELTKENDIKSVYNNIVIIFSTSKDADKQLISLQKILKSTKIEKEKLKEIDFRFNKTILRYDER